MPCVCCCYPVLPGPDSEFARTVLPVLVASLDALLLADIEAVTKAVVPESVSEDNTHTPPSLSLGDWVQRRKDAIALLARTHTCLLDTGSTSGTLPGVCANGWYPVHPAPAQLELQVETPIEA
jgi:hypothetical protein